MSYEITAFVEDVKKATAKNGKPYYKVYLTGEQYPMTAWSYQAIEGLRKGREAVIHFEEDNGFKRILDGVSVTQTNAEDDDVGPEIPFEEPRKPIETPAAPRSRFSDSKSDFGGLSRDDRIDRQSALKSAVAYVGPNPEEPVEAVLDIAREFLAFIREK
jgi:hypothetical protein